MNADPRNEENKASPWDLFINLLAVIALYSSTWAVLALLFSIVDLEFPDPLEKLFDLHDEIRYTLAILIIFFPAYVWAWRAIEIDLAAHPEKRRRWLRTCPIYLTLFIAGLLALCDLSFLVYYFLTGDLTLRFVLKVMATGIVAGSVLGFYWHLLRREPGPLPGGARIFGYAACATVTIVTVAGFSIAGSPTRARLNRLDAKRVENLDLLQRNILDFWQSKRILPPSLTKLNNDLVDFSIPLDPESRRPYGYRVTGDTSFEVCADFAFKNDDVQPTASSSWNSDFVSGPILRGTMMLATFASSAPLTLHAIR